MNRSDQDQMLHELLAEDLAELRRSTLVDGISAQRRKRRRRRTAEAGLLALIPVLVLSILWRPGMAKHQASKTGPVVVEPGNASPVDRAVKLITDEELFALFPDCPVALVGKPGHQQFMFLDRADATFQE